MDDPRIDSRREGKTSGAHFTTDRLSQVASLMAHLHDETLRGTGVTAVLCDTDGRVHRTARDILPTDRSTRHLAEVPESARAATPVRDPWTDEALGILTLMTSDPGLCGHLGTLARAFAAVLHLELAGTGVHVPTEHRARRPV